MKFEILTALYCLAGLATANPIPRQPTLNEAAVAAGKMYFGTATNQDPEWSNKEYVNIMLEQFGSLTPANVQKWQFTEPEQGVFNYTQGDQFADFSLEHKKVLLCDTLVWHQEYPAWLDEKEWTKEELLQVIDQHVFSEVSHYKGKCFSWNVVNEALNDDGTWRETLYYNVTGTDFIETAFAAARRADPHAQLYYNDYNIESPGAKATAAANNIIKPLRKKGLIDAIGLESHFIVGETPDEAQQQQQMQAYIDLGVDVVVSELDVRFSSLPPTAAGQAQQVTDYLSSINACIAVGKKCMGISVWDFADEYSWIPSTFAGQGDADLYDQNLNPKVPLINGIISALEKASKRW
ncbi:hypothetical protein AWJ20_717 [Sugiyamaella lignohabitans]|uniref:Beta-xylanase n=1 Tax=Sugiyamaella lignohabitans TaxID=796027 RepID=A0A167D4B5_9ASCO|nr:uncharacterized protein AWJ20_717 [Sugiyamaella lignohabitans]ANB12462.1 hypothetical protein AWJ20_717 [Sugiyamaella lignohabitans]